MCLIALLTRGHAEIPLLVAANRDEFLARPSIDFGVLRRGPPMLLGGQDARAGGTWMATGAHGVVAGLTNRPQPTGSDPSKRSRGELPLLMAAQPSAQQGALMAATLSPADFNPCYLVVADRDAAFYLDFAGGDPTPRQLAPGLHVLENRPLGAPSAKAVAVAEALGNLDACAQDDLLVRVTNALRSHAIPAEDPHLEPWRPEATRATCVHVGPYGTRSATVVMVPAAANENPAIWSTERAPCQSPFCDRRSLWHS